MGQKSSIDRLDPTIRKQLLELLKNPAVTQLEIVETINAAAGETAVSRSSINRYKLKMDKLIEKSRQAREVADVFVERHGNNGSSNSMGKVINEQIRLAVFDLMQDFEELKESEKFDAEKLSEILYKVSRALKELEQAEKLNAEREEKIRKQVLEETLSKVEDAAEKKLSIADVLAELKAELTGQNNAKR